MPLSLAQAHALIAAAHDHAAANGWKIAVAVVDEGGHLIALGRASGRITERTTANGLRANRSTTLKRVQQRLKDRAGT